MGISDGASSPRFEVYGHTLHEIDPELSTLRVDRQEGQKGQVILKSLLRVFSLENGEN